MGHAIDDAEGHLHKHAIVGRQTSRASARARTELISRKRNMVEYTNVSAETSFTLSYDVGVSTGRLVSLTEQPNE